jgi:ubiquinone/menaquinone biosynthesis C-methylase UbiE
MLAIAAERMPEARLVEGDALPLPFGDGEFDLVFTSHFLHHLEPEGRAEFLAEARRVGRELVVVEGVRSPDEPPEEWLEQVGGDGRTHRHYRRAYTADELVEELGGGEVLHAGRWFTAVASW